MARDKELEFKIPEIMEEPEHEGLTYLYRFLRVKNMDWVRGRIKVIVPADRIDRVMKIAKKSNFELTQQ